MKGTVIQALCHLAFLICCAVRADQPPALRLVSGTISSLQYADDSAPPPVDTFYADDTIYFHSEVSWDQPRHPDGAHQLLYKWYSNDELVLSFNGARDFSSTPARWSAYVTTRHLKPGRERAELYLDGNLLDHHEFELKDGSRPAESSLRDSIKRQGMTALWHGDTAAFDRLANGFRQTRERSPAGIWKLSLLYNCLQKLDRMGPRDKGWDTLEGTAAHWLEANPDSPAAVIMYAKLLHEHAWAWRGDGYAGQVREADWGPFRAYLERARLVLDDHANVAARDPEWDAERISVALEQGAGSNAILAMADAALGREAYYYPIHYEATRALSERWGGSEEWIKRYVQLALERSREKEGTQAYARIYFDIARKSGDWIDQLNRSGAKWPAMKQSLAEILKAHPDPFNLDMARALSCGLDRETYRSYGRRGGHPTEPVAPFDTPEERRDCDAWAFEGKDMPTGSVLDIARGYFSFLRGFGEVFWWRVRLAALILFLALELALWLRMRAERSAHLVPLTGGMRSFNPGLYPRSYRHTNRAQALSNHSAIALTASAGAAAWAFTTVPWSDSGRSQATFMLLVLAASAGLLLLLHNLVSRVVLSAGAIEVHGLFGMRSRHRGLLRGWRMQGNAIVLETREPPGQPLLIREAAYADDAFWGWFASLPRLDETAEEYPSDQD